MNIYLNFSQVFRFFTMPKGNFMLNKRFTNRNRKPKGAPPPVPNPYDQPGSSSSAEESRAVEETEGKSSTKPVRALFTPNVQWAPGVYAAFKILLSLRITSAVWSPISDCDEVYNYWEPLHLFLYGRGFQTWEYSPAYGLRSYLYVLLYYPPAELFRMVLPNTKVTTFYFVRCFIALTDAAADVFLYSTVCERISNNVGRLYLFFRALGPGAFVAGAAFLPSSFSGAVLTAATAFWLSDRWLPAIFCVAAASLLGWPFAAVLGLPVALDAIFRRKNVKNFVIYALVAGISLISSLILVDSYFYGKFTLAPLNIVLYNVLNPGGGPSLYGEEPWSYYVLNLFLNWNLVFPLATVSVFVVAAAVRVCYSKFRDWTKFSPLFFMQISLWLWMAIFFYQKHKEERFMFPVYFLICLSAALSLDCANRLWKFYFSTSKRRNYFDFFVLATIFAFSVASSSRIFALYRNYYAPFDVYMAVNEKLNETSSSSASVCVSKEWYRFPSSFFLPDNIRLNFVRSEFRGLLPKPYDDRLRFPDVTRHIPGQMNNMNLEEPSRYVSLDSCDYLVDFDIGDTDNQLEPNYSDQSDRWTILYSSKFLHSTKSNRFFRAFYVPFVGDRYCTFGSYNLLKKNE